MSFEALLTHRFVVERPVTETDSGETVTDEMGHLVRTFETHAYTNGLAQEKSARERILISEAGAVIGDYTIFLPIMDIVASDRIAYVDPADWSLAGIVGAGPETRFEITGIRNAAGRNHHLQVDARVISASPEEMSGS
jgi:hypothetical protein